MTGSAETFFSGWYHAFGQTPTDEALSRDGREERKFEIPQSLMKSALFRFKQGRADRGVARSKKIKSRSKFRPDPRQCTLNTDRICCHKPTVLLARTFTVPVLTRQPLLYKL